MLLLVKHEDGMLDVGVDVLITDEGSQTLLVDPEALARVAGIGWSMDDEAQGSAAGGGVGCGSPNSSTSVVEP